MNIPFWIRQKDFEALNDSFPADITHSLSEYAPFPDVIMGQAGYRDIYELRGKKDVVFASIEQWDNIKDARQLKVEIEAGPLHPWGVVLTAYSWVDVVLNRHKKLITQKRDVEREEFLYHPDFIGRVFNTYYNLFLSGRVKKDYAPRLILFDTQKVLKEENAEALIT